MANYQFKPAARFSTNKMHPTSVGRVIMKKRPLGDTGILVGEVGLGTGPLGRSGMRAIPDHEALEFIAASLDQEACLIDTAPTYGEGRAERLVGKVLKGRRKEAVVMTKAGYLSDGQFDFSPSGLRKSLEGSLKRLGTDCVDVLLLHNPPDKLLSGPDAAWDELEKMKKEGKIRAHGACVSGSLQIKSALEKTPARVLAFPFSPARQEAAASFALAAQKKAGLVACSPLDQGFLTGRYGKFALFFDERAGLSRSEISAKAAFVEKYEGVLPPRLAGAHMAIQFALAHPELSACVPGASDWHQLVLNVAAASESLPGDLFTKLKALA